MVSINGECFRTIAREIKAGDEFIKKHNLTLCEFDMIYWALMDLWNSGTAETISAHVAEILKEYGFEIQEKGIGFSVCALV